MRGGELVKDMLSSRLVSRLFSRATAGTVVMFVLHRVAGAGHAFEGIHEDTISSGLERLWRDGYNLVSVDDVVTAGREGRELPRRSVAFTADDGYHDQAEVLAPLFARFECPLTIFPLSGFVDRQLVPWWDRVGHALTETARTEVRAAVGDEIVDLSLSTDDERRESNYTFLRAAKRLSDGTRERSVDDLVTACEVDVPSVPFGRFQPMTWDDARRLEAGGLVRCGPHTIRHPILARLNDPDEVAAEVNGSWQRLRDEMGAPLPVFCYPNGERGDFGAREVEVVRAAGLSAAVTVTGGPTVVADLRDDDRRFALARVPFPASVPALVHRASGLDIIRRSTARDTPAD